MDELVAVLSRYTDRSVAFVVLCSLVGEDGQVSSSPLPLPGFPHLSPKKEAHLRLHSEAAPQLSPSAGTYPSVGSPLNPRRLGNSGRYSI